MQIKWDNKIIHQNDKVQSVAQFVCVGQQALSNTVMEAFIAVASPESNLLYASNFTAC